MVAFQQIHIEVARNATDDFNPFHDKLKWQRIHRNPFGGPIVMGFQLQSLIEHRIKQYRIERDELPLIATNRLRYSNYQFTFASAVSPEQQISIDIKKSQLKPGDNTMLSNRVSLKADGSLALLGYKRESQQPLFLPEASAGAFGPLEQAADRSFLPGTEIFLKRKYMNNSNAKNFLTGSLVEQADYFDEIEDRVVYPEIFPCALISCALLEKAKQKGHDFEVNPMVYSSHRITVDRIHLDQLRSNNCLHILVEQTRSGAEHSFDCFGVVGTDKLLYRAQIDLIALEAILE